MSFPQRRMTRPTPVAAEHKNDDFAAIFTELEDVATQILALEFRCRLSHDEIFQ